MAQNLESILRATAAAVRDPERAEALWADYRAGGPGADEAVHTLQAWYGRDVYGRIWGQVRSDAAEDVYQEVLARLHAHRRSRRLERFGDQVLPWLRRVADNACVDHHRREARRRRREARRAVSAADATPPDGHPGLCEAVAAALARLSPKHRRAICLLMFEGLTVEEAAKAEGVSRVSLAARRDAALLRLRDLLPAGAVAAGAGSAGVEGALAAGRPAVSEARLRELAGEALRRAVPGPALGKAAGALVVGLALGGVGLAGWAATRETEQQAPPPVAVQAPVAERETLQAQNLRILKAEVLPKLVAGLGKLVGGEPIVTHTRAEGSEVYVYLAGRRPVLNFSKPPQAQMRFCVLSRRLVARVDASGTGDWSGSDLNNIRVEVGVGQTRTVDVPIRHLGLREAFDLLPEDDRAGAEFHRFHLDGTPYGGPELVLPGQNAEYAANSRYLYLDHYGHLLAWDARGGFTGWKRIGAERGVRRGLAATDRLLFAAADSVVMVRPAEPTPHPWRLLCPMPPATLAGGWLIAAAGDRLFVLDGRRNLWARPATDGPGEWRPAGRVPAEGGAILGTADRLYYWDEDLTVCNRPAASDGLWESFGRWESPGTRQQLIWAGRLVHWNPDRHGGPVEARPLTPRPALGTPIGRVDSKTDFLNWRW